MEDPRGDPRGGEGAHGDEGRTRHREERTRHERRDGPERDGHGERGPQRDQADPGPRIPMQQGEPRPGDGPGDAERAQEPRPRCPHGRSEARRAASRQGVSRRGHILEQARSTIDGSRRCTRRPHRSRNAARMLRFRRAPRASGRVWLVLCRCPCGRSPCSSVLERRSWRRRSPRPAASPSPAPRGPPATASSGRPAAAAAREAARAAAAAEAEEAEEAAGAAAGARRAMEATVAARSAPRRTSWRSRRAAPGRRATWSATR